MANSLRKGLIALVAAAVAVTFVGGLLVLVLNTGGEEVAGPPPTTVQPDEDASTTTLAVTDDASGRDGEAATSDLYPYPAGEGIALPAMGIDIAEFDWTVVELFGSTNGEAWVNQLIEVDGVLWAVGGRYDPAEDRASTMVYTSTDGVTWERRELPPGLGDADNLQLTATGAGLVGVVNQWDEDTARSQMRVFLSSDGDNWSEADLSGFVSTDEYMWINQVAGGDGILVLVGMRESAPAGGSEPVAITIDSGGFVITLDEKDWSFTITDSSSGEVVAQGSQELIWDRGDTDEFGIYDGAELVFSMGWNDLGEAAAAAYQEVAWGEPLIVQVVSGDRTLSVNEFTGEFAVTDASGAVVFQGDERDLWQGPPPVFRDPDTGEVIVVVPWDDWNAAHEAAYPTSVAPSYATTVMLRSVDGGATWNEVDFGIAEPGFYIQSLLYGPGGFVAVGTQEPVVFEAAVAPTEPYQPSPPILLTSVDGLAWQRSSAGLGAGTWLQVVAATDDGLLAVASDQEGSRVVASGDGTSWQGVLDSDDLGLEIGQVWFERIARGGLGTVATGTYDAWVEPQQPSVTITRAGRTLTVEGSVYTVTDDATGAVLFTYDETVDGYRYLEEAPVGAPSSGLRWGQGGPAFFADDGTVIFAVPSPEFEEAMAAAWGGSSTYYEPEQALLYDGGAGWARVLLPDELGATTWFGGIVVTDSALVLSATSETSRQADFVTQSLVLVGVPKG